MNCPGDFISYFHRGGSDKEKFGSIKIGNIETHSDGTGLVQNTVATNENL